MEKGRLRRRKTTLGIATLGIAMPSAEEKAQSSCHTSPCEECDAYECVKNHLASELGLPSPESTLYDGITTIASTVVDRRVSTSDSTTVRLQGNGVTSPLRAALTPDAITSPDGTVSVTTSDTGNIQLSTLVTSPLFQSPDSSITITPPTTEGSSYLLTGATTFTSSSTITSTVTAGTVSTPPNITHAIPSTAIQPNSTTAGIIPLSVTYGPSGFSLGVPEASLPSTNVVLPNTFIVGGTVPGTPSGPTLEGAIAYINALAQPPTAASPWQIVVCPGVYGSVGTSVTLPLNTNLVALQQGTATLQHNLSYADTTGTTNITLISGLTLTGLVSVTTSGKTGGTTNILFHMVKTTGTYTSSLRPSTPPTDRVVWSASTLNFTTVSLTGGLVEFSDSRVTGGAWSVPSSTTALGTKVQLKNSVFQPSSYTQGPNNFTSSLGAVLGGSWTVDGAGSYCSVQNCTVSPTWTLQPSNNSQSFIKGTNLYTVITKLTAGTWSLTQPNLIPPTTGGSVDRDLRMQLIGLPTISIGTLSIALPVPLTTGFTDVVGPLPYSQNPVSTLQAVSNGTGLLPSLASTTSSIVLTNQLTLLQSFASVTVDVPTPSRTLWY